MGVFQITMKMLKKALKEKAVKIKTKRFKSLIGYPGV